MKPLWIVLSLLLIAGLALTACATPAPAPEVEPAEVPAAEPESPEATEPPAVEEPAAGEPAAEEPVQPEAAAGGPLPDLGGREIVAVTGNDYVPLNFVDPDTGQSVGWEYDAVEEICRRINCTVDWNVTAWDTMISAVREGQFDVGMDGITITEERAQQVDFSDPHLRSEQFMLVRADEERFTTPEEFAAQEDLLIGSQAGTTNFYVAVYDVLDGDEQNPRIRLFETFGAAVQALLTGDVDMVLMDAASSRGYIGANPDQLKIVGEPLASEDFGFIFTPDSDLVEPFNAAIATMKVDAFFDHLNNKWFFRYDPGAAQ